MFLKVEKTFKEIKECYMVYTCNLYAQLIFLKKHFSFYPGS